jgi:hypothetical protein
MRNTIERKHHAAKNIGNNSVWVIKTDQRLRMNDRMKNSSVCFWKIAQKKLAITSY